MPLIQKRTGSFGKRLILGCLAILLGAVLPVAADSLSKAEELYQRTDYEASLTLLNKKTQDPATNFLIGRDYFMQADWSKATEFLLKAAEEQPNSSEYMDWLGRAYGRRAENSNMLTAPGFASKTRQAFERAVELDPRNSDALADLFDYYLDAPGFMGGGDAKATAVADKMAALDPPEAYYEKAKLAQKRKQFNTAEAQLRQAVAAAPQQVGHILSLAKFLANQGRTQESEAMFQQAEQVNPNAARVWYAHADVLVKQNRDLDQAKAMLQKYLHASLTPDDPPKQAAARLLQQVNRA